MNKPIKNGDRIVKPKYNNSITDIVRHLCFHLKDGMPPAFIEVKAAEGEPILVEKPVDWFKMLCQFYEKVQAPHEEKMRKLLAWIDVIKGAHEKGAAKIGAFNLQFHSVKEDVKAEKRKLKSEVRLEDPAKHKSTI